MTGKKLLYEAGAKKVYNGDSEDQLIVTFTDQLLSNHGSNTGKIKGKASMSNTISSQIFEYLESYNVMTCFLSKIGDKEMQIKNTEILPFDIIVLNAVNLLAPLALAAISRVSSTSSKNCSNNLLEVVLPFSPTGITALS